MELNHDVVRNLLLAIEQSDNMMGLIDKDTTSFMKENSINRAQLAYTVEKLREADFITGKVTYGDNQPMWIDPGNLTYNGHAYLDNIRDNKIWAGVKKASSSLASISLSQAATLGASLVAKALGI